MLFDTGLKRELTRSFVATLVIVLTVVLTMTLVRILGQAAKGQASPQDVLLLLGLATLGNLAQILALALFVAIVLTLGRMYRDHEMVVWFCSGTPLRRCLRPVARVAAPVMLLVAATTLIAWPWVNRQSVELREQFLQRSDVSRVSPGTFQTSGDGRRVFFIENDRQDLTVARNVFIVSQISRGESMTTARSGFIEFEGEDRFITLEKGQLNEMRTDTGERTLIRFDSYRVVIDAPQVRPGGLQSPKAISTLKLAEDPDPALQGELAWRLGMVLAAGNLTLLGVGLAHVNPRRMNNWNLLLALLVFISYLNLINLSKAWVASDRIEMIPTLLVLHGGALLAALGLLTWRHHGVAVRLGLSTRKVAA